MRDTPIAQIVDGALSLDDLLVDHFLRDLHGMLYRDIWTWAGRLRTSELNLGVAPEQIAVELRSSLDALRWRWEHTSDWTARVLGVAVHAETVASSTILPAIRRCRNQPVVAGFTDAISVTRGSESLHQHRGWRVVV